MKKITPYRTDATVLELLTARRVHDALTDGFWFDEVPSDSDIEVYKRVTGKAPRGHKWKAWQIAWEGRGWSIPIEFFNFMKLTQAFFDRKLAGSSYALQAKQTTVQLDEGVHLVITHCTSGGPSPWRWGSI